jgi:ribosomal protein S18 acetylase RimI-like enzyme
MDERSSDRKVPFRWGTALFNSGLPLVYALNFLYVEDRGDVTCAELIAAADEIQGTAGLGHRKIDYRGEGIGGKLLPEFRAAGWEVERDLVMIRRRPPDRMSPAGLGGEASRDEVTALIEEITRREPYGRDERVVSQLLARLDVVGRATNLRLFGARIDGRLVAYCELYSDGHTAQIESVNTIEEFRGRGLARAVTSEAMRAATESGCDLTFLLADDDDWPKELYRKLGFDPIGRNYVFIRPRPE